MALNRSNISPEQQAAIDKAKAILSEAFDSASGKIRWSDFEDLEMPCEVTGCTCSSFRPGGLLGTCKRDTCRHSFIAHGPPI